MIERKGLCFQRERGTSPPSPSSANGQPLVHPGWPFVVVLTTAGVAGLAALGRPLWHGGSFEFIPLSFWYDAPLRSRDRDRRHDHGWCTVHRAAVPPDRDPGFHEPDARRVSAAGPAPA